MIQFSAGNSVVGNIVHFIVLDEREIQTLKAKDGFLTVEVNKVNPELKIEVVLSYTPETSALEKAMTECGDLTLHKVMEHIEVLRKAAPTEVQPLKKGERVPIKKFRSKRRKG